MTDPELVIFGPSDAITLALHVDAAREGRSTRFEDANVPEGGVRTETEPDSAWIDFADRAQLDAALAKLCPRTIMLYPSWFHAGAFLDTSPASWREALRANFERPAIVLQAAARRLIEVGEGGRIVVLSHLVGSRPLAGGLAAGTGLAALRAFCGMAAVDLAPFAITVNTLALGWLEHAVGLGLAGPTAQERLVRDIPTGGLGASAAVVRLCRLLAEPDMGYLTGAVIPLDGGFLLTRTGGPSPLLVGS